MSAPAWWPDSELNTGDWPPKGNVGTRIRNLLWRKEIKTKQQLRDIGERDILQELYLGKTSVEEIGRFIGGWPPPDIEALQHTNCMLKSRVEAWKSRAKEWESRAMKAELDIKGMKGDKEAVVAAMGEIKLLRAQVLRLEHQIARGHRGDDHDRLSADNERLRAEIARLQLAWYHARFG